MDLKIAPSTESRNYDIVTSKINGTMVAETKLIVQTLVSQGGSIKIVYPSLISKNLLSVVKYWYANFLLDYFTQVYRGLVYTKLTEEE